MGYNLLRYLPVLTRTTLCDLCYSGFMVFIIETNFLYIFI